MPILRSLVRSILHPALCVSDCPKRSHKGNKNRSAGSSVNADKGRLSGKDLVSQLKSVQLPWFYGRAKAKQWLPDLRLPDLRICNESGFNGLAVLPGSQQTKQSQPVKRVLYILGWIELKASKTAFRPGHA